jgi:hypothetical protein
MNLDKRRYEPSKSVYLRRGELGVTAIIFYKTHTPTPLGGQGRGEFPLKSSKKPSKNAKNAQKSTWSCTRICGNRWICRDCGFVDYCAGEGLPEE